MLLQDTLFDIETAAEKKFQDFHVKNPHVYRQLVKMSQDLYYQGHRKIGIGMLFEVIRWRTMMTTTDEDYKLNNNYRSRYARKIMDEYPMLIGMFNLRDLRS